MRLIGKGRSSSNSSPLHPGVNSSHQGALRRALAVRSTKRLVHLGLEHLLHHRTGDFIESIRVRKKNVYDGSAGGLLSILVMVAFLRRNR